jgi:hypothetical protein
MPALTPAERQQRRRDKLAAARPPAGDVITSPIETRMTRQEAWDEACDRLDHLLETYRAWKLANRTPADELSAAALPGLASQILTLTLTTLALDFGREWYFAPGQDPVAAADRPPMPARSLRELVLGAPRLGEENEPGRTPEQDAAARAWWAGMEPHQQANWRAMANCAEPEDVYHLMRDVIRTIHPTA